MRNLILLCAMLLASVASAANRYVMTLTVTNLPVTSNTLVFSAPVAKTITWTNNTTTVNVNTNTTIGRATTNLFLHFAAYAIGAPRLFPQMSSSNVITLTGERDQLITAVATNSGYWASISYTTNLIGLGITVVVQQGGILAGVTNNAQWVASQLVTGLGSSSNSLATNSIVNSNFLSLGISIRGGTQTVEQIVQFNKIGNSTNTHTIYGGTNANGTLRGVISAEITNLTAYGGYFSNGIFHTPIMTNGANYGNAFGSPGSGASSDQFGSSAVASGSQSFAAGPSAFAGGPDTLALGSGANAGTNSANVAMGSGATGFYNPANRYGENAAALGTSTRASGTNSGALFVGSISDYNDSYAIAGTATDTNQILIGATSHRIYSPGLFLGNSHSNTTIKGTNRWDGDLAFVNRANTALANGNNSGVILGTNVYVRLSGPSGAYTNAGFLAERDGSFHILQFDNPAINMTILNQSGVDAVAANRIVTGTGADVNFTNNPVVLTVIYDATASRWRIIKQFP